MRARNLLTGIATLVVYLSIALPANAADATAANEAA